MARQYFRKKDPCAQNHDVEWIEMSGQEFYQFVSSPEGRGRYFIDMDDYVIEASKTEYTTWRREKDHSDYLKEHEADCIILSLYSDNIAECGNGESVITDRHTAPENGTSEYARNKALYEALSLLDAKSYKLIHALFLEEKPKSLRKLSKETGIPVMTLQNRKKKILMQLRDDIIKKLF